MKEDNTQQRILAVERFNNGESPESICTSFNKSRAWLYKWVSRYDDRDTSWCESRSCRPKRVAHYTPAEVVEIVKMVRLNLYNQDLFCGAQAIHWEMEELGLYPLPSIRTINRILSRYSLTHRRTGKYEAKGTAYPALPSVKVNQTHQADFVGPCYLKGPVRFYSLNVIDTATVLTLRTFPGILNFFALVNAFPRGSIIARHSDPDRIRTVVRLFIPLHHPAAAIPLACNSFLNLRIRRSGLLRAGAKHRFYLVQGITFGTTVNDKRKDYYQH